MRDLMLKTAAVLEAAAALIDSDEQAKTAAEQKKVSGSVEKIAAQYLESTGEELSDEMRQKIARDPAALEIVQTVIEKTGGSVASMGHGGRQDTTVSTEPQTKEDRIKAAHEKFGEYLSRE